MDGAITTIVAGVVVAVVGAIVAFYLGGLREKQKREYEKRKEEQRRQEERQKERSRGLTASSEQGELWRLLRVLGVAVLGVVVVFALFLLLNWYVAPTKPSDRKDLVLALAQILGGTALLLGLYFTWRTLQVNREGQITDRFTRAIDQLGSEKLEIALGGIYSLERISRESEADHWSIMEVLTAYIRQHAPWPPLPEEDQQGEEVPTPAPDNQQGEEVPTPAPDIQAIITVLRRRTRYHGHGEPEPLHLRETNLSRGSLAGANLSHATLWHANLSRAHLRKANLREAILRGAILWQAILWEADLREAMLWEANLSEADLRGADLSGANLSGADLRGADLREVKHLRQAQLEETRDGDEHTRLPVGREPPAHWRRED